MTVYILLAYNVYISIDGFVVCGARSDKLLKIPSLHSWISVLPDSVRDKVIAQMQRRRYSDGDSVWVVGDKGTACFLIESGRICMCNYSADGKEVRMGELLAGDCFGEMALIDHLPRFNNVYAVGEAVLLVLQQDRFQALYETHAEIARALNVFLSYRLRFIYINAADASVLNLRDRLIRLVTRLGYGVPREVDGSCVVDNISHETLANMVGATRQGTSRVLKALEQDGLVEISYGKLRIPDLRKMARQCEHWVSGDLIVPRYGE